MTLPLMISVAYGEKETSSFAMGIAVTALFGLALYLPFFRRAQDINRRHAFCIVSFGWLSASVLGAIPFALSDSFAHPLDAFFETVSGFTTTGASVLTAIDPLPKSILFWRSIIQWLGGMGIILLSIAILPFLGIGGMQLFRAEVPSPFLDKLKPRIAETAKILWQTYLLITALEVAFLWLGGMSIFDSFCHAFTTMATGGFSTKTESVGGFGTYHRIVITIFMFLAGTNFALHYRFMKGDYGGYKRDKEFCFYLLLSGIAIIAVWLVLMRHMDGSWGRSLEESAFQVISIMTTTGFATVDFDQWPSFCRYLLFLLMFIGGCAGSTGGGIKCVRVLLLCKYIHQEFRKIIHPHAVFAVKLGNQTISPAILNGIVGLFILFIGIFVSASVAMCLLGLDIVTSISSVAATLGNIGPGLAAVGPTANYGHIPLVGKLILIFCMLAGRLEIYTVVILFFPEFWKK
ncbi:MAG: TrkH family potassium uptake protein [Deltaproteobacteria bacterium]|nr:TrkH family potassium uptake protein [Deltaproteobacteria bacterium]